MTAIRSRWITAQKALLWAALIACALGLFVLASVVWPSSSSVVDAIGGIAVLGAPALLVLAAAPVMTRRSGEPALWYLLLAIAVGLLSLWMGGTMAAYAA